MSTRKAVSYLFLPAVFCIVPNIVRAAPDTAVDATILEEVVVEESGEPEADLPLGIGISGETLKSTAGSSGDPLRTLQTLPGMVFVDDESAEPAVRGSRPGDNYLESDFLPIGYLFHAGGVISVFNSELVESFNIYSSAYGPEYFGVTGGVFDIRLRDPKKDKFQASLDVSFLQSGLLLEGPVSDTQSFYLAGRFSYLDLIVEDQLDEDDGITYTQFPKYTDYQSKYLWELNENSEIRFQANGATDEFDVNVAEDSEEIAVEPIFAGRSFEATSFDQQGVVWDWNKGGRKLKTSLSHSRADSKQQAGGAGSFDVESDSWLLKSQLFLPLSERHDLTVGGDFTHLEFAYEVAFNDPACTEFETDCGISGADRLETTETIKLNSTHLFVKDNWYLTDKLTLFPGVSAQTEDYLDKQFIEPRFALEYELKDDLTLSAGLGEYHQIADFNQIDAVFGNPDLDYIESTHAVVGLNKKFSSGWELKSELYYKKLDNLVTGDDSVRYTNQGEGEAYGIDTLIRKNLTDRFSGWMSLSLSEATRTNLTTGEEFPFDYDQPVNLTLVANYKLSSRWSLGAKYWMHSGAAYTPIIGAVPDDEIEGYYNPQYGKINSERFPSFSRLDARLDWTKTRASGKKTSFYLELLNLLDNENLSYYDYNSDYTVREEVYQLPFIFGFGFKTEI